MGGCLEGYFGPQCSTRKIFKNVLTLMRVAENYICIKIQLKHESVLQTNMIGMHIKDHLEELHDFKHYHLQIKNKFQYYFTFNVNNTRKYLIYIYNFYTGCPDGRYGRNCDFTCGKCLKGQVCERRTGTCPMGCKEGWTGPQCRDSMFIYFDDN